MTGSQTSFLFDQFSFSARNLLLHPVKCLVLATPLSRRFLYDAEKIIIVRHGLPAFGWSLCLRLSRLVSRARNADFSSPKFGASDQQANAHQPGFRWYIRRVRL